jgi:hypothetical protein
MTFIGGDSIVLFSIFDFSIIVKDPCQGRIPNDLDIKGRKVHLFGGEKNSMGRVVYLSKDALFAIKLWFSRRDKNKEFVFYGQGNGHLCYSTGRGLFLR